MFYFVEMTKLQSNAHAVAAIRERLAAISGELLAMDKRWRELREAHAALSQTLRMFDPGADGRPVAPKRPYSRAWPRDKGKLSRLFWQTRYLARDSLTKAPDFCQVSLLPNAGKQPKFLCEAWSGLG
jgi:hypothetical protein